MSESKTPKVVFAPGCFDSFDGSQEELDQLVGEIKTMFENMTPEELAERSVAVDLDEIEDLFEDDLEVLDALDQSGNLRTLQ